MLKSSKSKEIDSSLSKSKKRKRIEETKEDSNEAESSLNKAKKRKKKGEMKDGPTEQSTDSSSDHFQRKLERRDKKIASLKAVIVRKDEEIKTLQVNVGSKGENQGQVAVLSRKVRDVENRNEELLSERSLLIDKNRKLAAELLKLDPKTRPTGWEKDHPNHRGKRIPADDEGKMVERLESQSHIGVDCEEIQRGAFVRFLKGTKAFGYYAEAGTNLIVPKDVIIPQTVFDLAMKKAKECLNIKEMRSGVLTSIGRAETLFDELITCLYYSFVGDHQGPVYIDGLKPVAKPTFMKDINVSVSEITAEQSHVLIKFIEYAMAASKLNKETEHSQKVVLVRTLYKLRQHHRKQSFTNFSLDKGRAQRKMELTHEMDPGKAIVEQNRHLPKQPPLYDGRNLPDPICGYQYDAKIEKKARKAKSMESKSRHTKLNKKGDKQQKRKQKAVEKLLMAHGEEIVGGPAVGNRAVQEQSSPSENSGEDKDGDDSALAEAQEALGGFDTEMVKKALLLELGEDE